MAMDSTLQEIWKETMRKEQKYARKCNDQLLARKVTKAPEVTATLKSMQPSHSSCQINYLDQTLGIKKTPHGSGVFKDPNATPTDLLLFGVSAEGEGRKAYLLNKKKSGGPHERYGRAVTSAQEVGWTSKMVTTYTSSPFARRPLVKNDFFRAMGVSLSTGVL
mmetsp:Transcript_7129/g.11553  ORF Transcript_7129/g.11553 Transcript_7129/m.11553 type:complete len:163 (+) Transcript_7129:68-556(+)